MSKEKQLFSISVLPGNAEISVSDEITDATSTDISAETTFGRSLVVQHVGPTKFPTATLARGSTHTHSQLNGILLVHLKQIYFSLCTVFLASAECWTKITNMYSTTFIAIQFQLCAVESRSEKKLPFQFRRNGNFCKYRRLHLFRRTTILGKEITNFVELLT